MYLAVEMVCILSSDCVINLLCYDQLKQMLAESDSHENIIRWHSQSSAYNNLHAIKMKIYPVYICLDKDNIYIWVILVITNT